MAMTCIIGLRRHGSVWIGADTSGISNDGWGGITLIKTTKVWKRGPFVFGGSGSWRAIQLVRHILDLGKLLITNRRRDDPINEAFMVCDLVPAIKKIMDDNGFSEKEKSKSLQSGEFLIGVDDKLFYLQGDFAVTEIEGPFTTIGSGEYVARGAMEILVKNTRLKPEEMIERALAATAKHITTVGPPGKIVTTAQGD